MIARKEEENDHFLMQTFKNLTESTEKNHLNS